METKFNELTHSIYRLSAKQINKAKRQYTFEFDNIAIAKAPEKDKCYLFTFSTDYQVITQVITFEQAYKL